MSAAPAESAPSRTGLGFWLGALVALGSVLSQVAFAAIGILRPEKIERDGAMDGAAHVFAMYVAARVLPLAFAVLTAVAVRSRPALRALTLLAAGIHACDALVGALGHHTRLTLGPAALAVATLTAALFLLRPPR